MSGTPLLGQQPLREHLSEQRVDEPVPAVRTDLQDTGVHRLAEQGDNVALNAGGLGDLAQPCRPHRPAGHSDQPSQFAGRARQPVPG